MGYRSGPAVNCQGRASELFCHSPAADAFKAGLLATHVCRMCGSNPLSANFNPAVHDPRTRPLRRAHNRKGDRDVRRKSGAELVSHIGPWMDFVFWGARVLHRTIPMAQYMQHNYQPQILMSASSLYSERSTCMRRDVQDLGTQRDQVRWQVC